MAYLPLFDRQNLVALMLLGEDAINAEQGSALLAKYFDFFAWMGPAGVYNRNLLKLKRRGVRNFSQILRLL